MSAIQSAFGSEVPAPTAANQYVTSNSSNQWTLTQLGTIGGNTYNAGWTVATSDLGGEALYSSASAGVATIPLNLSSVVGMSLAFRQIGTGGLSVAGASSVTVEGVTATTAQYQTLFARQVAANVWTVTASAPVTSLLPGMMPAGALAENFPRIFSTGNDSNLTTAIPFLAYGPVVEAGVSYGHIGFYVSGTAASSQTAAWLALLDITGKVLAVTANAGSSAWGGGATFAPVNVAFAAPLVSPVSQQTIVAACVTASGSVPTLRGGPNNSLGAIPPILGGNSAGGSLSTPPTVGATVTLASSSASIMPYYYLLA